MFEFLFGVSPQLFELGDFVLASEWPRWWLFGLVLAAAVMVIWGLAAQRKSLHGLRLLAIGSLQITMLALALLLVWQPSLRTEQLKPGDNVVALMLDGSQSMNYGGSDGLRITTALEVLQSNPLQQLASQSTLQHFLFHDHAKAVDSFTGVAAEGTKTQHRA